MDWLMYVVSALLLVGAGLALWMVFVEPTRFRVWRVSLPGTEDRSPGEVALRAGRISPLRILHITDTHFGTRDSAKLDFARRVAREPCDLVFLTGDLIDVAEGIEPCLEMVEMLHPRFGIYAVLGGHDHFRGTDVVHKYTSLRDPGPPPEDRREPNPVERFRRGLVERGVEVLADESRIIQPPGKSELAIVGLRDAFVFDCDYDAAWEEVPENAPTVVLAHSPDSLEEIARRGADLAFFGHTHGGQVRLPLIGAVVTRSKLEASRARGIFREGETVFTLNHGMGAGIGSDFRFLCRPEVTLMKVEG
mgnify:CR=1 FL=1